MINGWQSCEDVKVHVLNGEMHWKGEMWDFNEHILFHYSTVQYVNKLSVKIVLKL